jgi:hypothetical protein
MPPRMGRCGAGSFTSSITGLSPGTIYHVRAYATNSVGTAYGSDLSFTTPASSFRFVNKNDPTCGGNSPCYTTIQAAINAAANGDEIKVAAGNYNEDINTTKTLTIRGGYDASFGSQSGTTRAKSMTLAGTVTLFHFALSGAGVAASTQKAEKETPPGEAARVITLKGPRSRLYTLLLQYNPVPGTMEHSFLELLKKTGLSAGYWGDDAFTPDAEHTESVRNLIIHFYKTILDREPEPWAINALEEGYFNYALSYNIGVKYVAGEMGRMFFDAEEYQNRKRTDAEFIADCYRAFLYRQPGDDELNQWLSKEVNRPDVLMTFATAKGFTKYIETLFPGFEGLPSRNFVTTMYIGLLDRLIMEENLLYWSAQLENAGDKQEKARLLALEAIVSEEFQDTEPTTSLVVIRLSRTFLGQLPTNEELGYWTGKLDSGTVTVDELIDRFGESKWFRGILKGFFPGDVK